MPNMKPAGCLGMPRFEDTPMGRRTEEQKRQQQIITPKPPKINYEPLPKIEYEPSPTKPPKINYEPLPKIKYEPPPKIQYEPPKIEILPIKPLWEKEDLTSHF